RNALATGYIRLMVSERPPVNPPVDPITPVTPTNPPAGEVKGPENAQEVLDNVADKLQEIVSGNSANKNEALVQAKKAIADAIEKATTIDMSGTVKVEGEVAKASIDVNAMKSAFSQAKE